MLPVISQKGTRLNTVPEKVGDMKNCAWELQTSCYPDSVSLYFTRLRHIPQTNLNRGDSLPSRRKMKHAYWLSIALLFLPALVRAQQVSSPLAKTVAPTAAVAVTKPASAADKHSTNPTLKPEPGGTVEYEWGIPVEVFADGHRKPLWKGNADTAKSARSYSEDSPEVRIFPTAPPKPSSTATQQPIPPDPASTNGAGADASPSTPASGPNSPSPTKTDNSPAAGSSSTGNPPQTQ